MGERVEAACHRSARTGIMMRLNVLLVVLFAASCWADSETWSEPNNDRGGEEVLLAKTDAVFCSKVVPDLGCKSKVNGVPLEKSCPVTCVKTSPFINKSVPPGKSGAPKTSFSLFGLLACL